MPSLRANCTLELALNDSRPPLAPVPAPAAGPMDVHFKVPGGTTRRVLVVSHYLPVTVQATGAADGGPPYAVVPFEGGNGGLFNAVGASPVRRVFVGQLADQYDPAVHAEFAQPLLEKHGCVAVYATKEETEGHYHQFCKELLWPLLHSNTPDYLRSLSSEDTSWQLYQLVNRRFAETIARIYQPDDIVWIHDYHLMLVPSLLRRRLPAATIGFFLHVPFPTSELFRCLHVRNEVLDGMLGADLVGFQTYSFARHFAHTCTRLLGYDTEPEVVITEDRHVTVGVFPIGIDVDEIDRRRQSAEVLASLQVLRARYADRRVLIGRDKLDAVKGIPQKLKAFDYFLQRYPEWVGKVILIQVAQVTCERKELQSQVSDLVSRINSKYGSLSYTPVVFLNQNLPTHEYLALLTLADAFLVTSLRDGMNLTSHEYVVCQIGQCHPLILSEFAGTYGSLAGALRINPWDIKEVSDSINEALTMSQADMQVRHACRAQDLLAYIRSNSGPIWTEAFLTALQRAQGHQINRPGETLAPPANLLGILHDYAGSHRRLLVFGYDGTFVRLHRTVDTKIVTPTPVLLEALAALASHEYNRVGIVSGRSRQVMEEWFGDVPDITLGAENGCFYRDASREWFTLSNLSQLEVQWYDEVLRIFESFCERTEGSVIERKEMSLTWNVQKANKEFAEWQLKNCLAHLDDAITNHYPVSVHKGKRNIEVRPSSITKASFLKSLLTTPCEPHVRDAIHPSAFERHMQRHGVDGTSSPENSSPSRDAWTGSGSSPTHGSGIADEDNGAPAATLHHSISAARLGPLSSRHSSMGIPRRLSASIVETANGLDKRSPPGPSGLSRVELPAAQPIPAAPLSARVDSRVDSSGFSVSPPLTATMSSLSTLRRRSTMAEAPDDARAAPDFVLCMGGDITDERMFEVLNDRAQLSQWMTTAETAAIYTCSVGMPSTLAQCALLLPADVLALVTAFANVDKGMSPEDALAAARASVAINRGPSPPSTPVVHGKTRQLSQQLTTQSLEDLEGLM